MGCLLLLVVGSAASLGAATVASLRCEYRDAPLGIDILRPRLSWVIASSQRGERQTAWQALVASTPELLAADRGDRWDSGKVADDRSIQVEYAGRPLASRERCYWKVRVWDRDGHVSPWSAPAQWTMGLLARTDWTAQWIGFDDADRAADAVDNRTTVQGLPWVACAGQQNLDGPHQVYLRRRIEIPADRTVRQATLVLYAFHEATAAVNGRPLGAAHHWEPTAKLDATAMLTAGANAVTIIASHTDPYPPAVIGKLVIAFTTGNGLTIPIDAQWKASTTAAPGWESASFDDHAWAAAVARNETPWKGAPPMADLPRVPPPYLRRHFTVDGPVRRAVVQVTALGAYELHLNGQRVSEDVLAPGWTSFRHRVHYQTYDVTALVRPGANAIGAILGDGWYASTLAHFSRRHLYGGRTRLLAQLDIELADGRHQVVASDGDWRAAYGPVQHADLLMGCAWDAGRDLPGWDMPDYADGAWKPVATGLAGVQGPIVEPRIQAAICEPSRPQQELPAISVTEPRPGCWTFDLGQNMVGWARLKVAGTAGQRLTVRHAEMLNKDGTIATAALRSCTAVDTYVLADGEHTLEPRFTFHGFRYVEVTGLTHRPDPSMVTGIVVHTPLRRTGTFASSHALLNQLYHNIIWGQKGNHLEIPTDCPQRDERMGWTGDTQFFVGTGACNFDVASFFTRWLQTCEDDQLPDGRYPHVVPDLLQQGGSTAWGDAAILCTWQMWQSYGDTRLIDERWASMEKYLQWLQTKTKQGIQEMEGFGDWLNAGGGAKKEVIDTAYHAHLARLMADMAAATGRTQDAERYARRHDEVKAAFIRAFLQSDGSLSESSQTGYALAFTMGLVPADMQAKVAGKFLEEIERFHGHLATGFIGTPRLLPALAAAGHDDVACRLLLTDTYPSWLYPVTLGATTMWERWNGWTPEQGFGDITMNSFNHYAFGAVGRYLYSGIGGIQATSPAYKTLRFRPVLCPGLDHAETALDTPYGRAATAWKRTPHGLMLDCTIPANTTAEVYLPTQNIGLVRESGAPCERIEGIRIVGAVGGAQVVALGAGAYAFRLPTP